MTKAEKSEIVQTLAQLIDMIDSEGYNVKSGIEPNYDAQMLVELNHLEKLSDRYRDALLQLSKDVRKYLWKYGKNSKAIYIIIHRLNLTFKFFSNIIGKDEFINMDVIMKYVEILHRYKYAYAPDISDKTFETIIDDVELANAKQIIKKQWDAVLAEPDGMKTFMEVFDDIFTNAFQKYPNSFFHQMSKEDVLCRMVTVGDCDEKRFIPLPECTNQNRWNPPGRSFLYMSYADCVHAYNEDLSVEEYVCLLECRTTPRTACSFCRFQPTIAGRVIDLSYNDTPLCKYRYIIQEHADEISHRGIEELLNDPEILQYKTDEQYVKNKIKEWLNLNLISTEIVEVSAAKQYLKMICSSIYTKVDGDETEKKKQYKSFHILSKYLEEKGVTGIIYPCTRSNKIAGKNIVLFNPADAQPIAGSIKRYFYTGA